MELHVVAPIPTSDNISMFTKRPFEIYQEEKTLCNGLATIPL